jgi:hypothetical protein
VNPERFGRDAAALSQLGGDIGDFGSRLMTARKRAMESDAISQAHSDDIKWITDTSQSLKLSYQKRDEAGQPIFNNDGSIAYNVDGFSKAFEEKLQARREEQMGKMPTGDAQRGYFEATNRLYGSAYADAMQWENVTKAQTYRQNFEIRNNAQANLLVNNPNLKVANESIEALRQELDSSIGNINSPGEAQQLFREGAKVRILALFNGYSNNPTTAREGLNVLNHITETAPRDYRTGELIMGAEESYPTPGTVISKSTDAAGKTTTVISGGKMNRGVFGSGLDARLVQESLNSNEIRTIRDRLEAVIKQGDHIKVNDLRGWARDQQALLTSTNPQDFSRYSKAETTQNLNEMKRIAQAGGPISKREYDETLIAVSLGTAYNQVRNEFAMMPPSMKSEFDTRLAQEYDMQLKGAGIDSSTFAFEHKKQYESLNQRVWAHFMNERKADIAAYVETYNPAKAGTIQNGIPDEARFRWRLGQAQSLEARGTLFTKGEVKQSVDQLKLEAEQNPQRAAARLWDMKANAGGFSGAAMEELVQRGKLPGYFKEAFYMDNMDVAQSIIQNQEPKMKEALHKSIVAVDKKALEGYVDGNFRATGAAFSGSGGIRPAQDLKEAVYLEAVRLHNENGASYRDAAKQATDKIVNSQYHLLGSAFMPKKIGTVITNADYVRGEMQAIYDPGVQTRLGIQPPASMDGKADRAMAISVGRWMTNPDNLGMTFMVPVAGHWTPVRSKDGTPVTIDFVKASINPSQEALDYNKPWWETIFGGSSKNAVPTQVVAPDQVTPGSYHDQMERFDPASTQEAGKKFSMSQAQLDVVKDPSLVVKQVYDKEKDVTITTLKDGRTIKMSGDALGRKRKK